MLLSRTVSDVFPYFFYAFTFTTCLSEGAIDGAEFWPTKGEVWPKPQSQLKYNLHYIVEPENFEFYAPTHTCAILEEALQRYWRIINSEFGPGSQFIDNRRIRTGRSTDKHSKMPQQKHSPRKLKKNRKQPHHNITHLPHTQAPQGQPHAELSPQVGVQLKSQSHKNLTQLRVQLTKPCEDLPFLEMDESYELSVGPTEKEEPAAVLDSRSVWGALRGLETFSQLLYRPDLDSDIIHINVTYIRDFPRFRHRGLLLDTSRHFLPVYRILQVLDAMSYNKLNVFHWHIVDDQSFPYQSLHFPTLSELGAYHHSLMVYHIAEIKMIVDHARVRGIRVLPEFDVPGHTRSWGEAFPKLLVQCYKQGKATEPLGPMDPTSEYTYEFLKNFFEEVMALFPDEYLHFGGNEVDYKCWESNPSIKSYMRQHNLTSRQLHTVFTTRLLKTTQRRPMLWAEATESLLPPGSLIQIWQDASTYQITTLTKSGHHVIFSSCWYLSRYTWRYMYDCEPRGLVPVPSLEPFVIGGEACMWGEMVDTTNILTSVFPRACAVAERLWSSLDTTNVTEAGHRLEEHTCRLNRRGIDAQPLNGPGFCL